MSRRTSPRERSPQINTENQTDSEDAEEIDELKRWCSSGDSSQDLEVDITGDSSPKPVRRSTRATPPDSSPKGRRRSPRLSATDYRRKPIHGQEKTLESVTGITHQYKHEESYHRSTKKVSPRVVPESAQKLPKQKSEATKDNTFLHSPLCVICIIAVILLCYCFLTGFISMQRQKSLVYSNDTLNQFNDRFQELKANFPSQGRRFWSTIKAATKRIISQSNVIQPAVILLAGRGDSRASIACLARQYAKMVTSVLQSDPAIEIEVNDFKGQDSNKMKLSLDEKLQGGFKRGSKVAVLHHLDAVHANAAMLLHAYCDNTNAPFKETVILLTMEVKDYKAGADHDIEEYLRQRWEAELTQDNFAALMSRILNNVVILEPESKEHLDKKCHM